VLKINLLPPYIYERRKIRQTTFLFGLIFMLVLGCMVTWWVMLGKKESNLEIYVAEMEQKADQVKALKELVRAEEAKIPPVEAKVDFIEGVMAYNVKVPNLYEELAKYTYTRVLYRSVSPSNNQLTIQAYARSVGDCGRYLLNLYRASHIFRSVAISEVPGYPTGGGEAAGPALFAETGTAELAQLTVLPRGFEFTVTCTLVEPIVVPTYSAAGAREPTEGLPAPGAGAPEPPL